MNAGYIPYALAIGLTLWLAVWCIYDAFDRTDYGFVWLVLFVMAPPLFIPIYLVMRFYVDRPPSKQELARRELDRERWREFRLSGEIEKAKFMARADEAGGTLYDPHASLQRSHDGYRHFTDERAETMLTTARFDECWDYLIDLYSMARSEGDGRAQDTYRNYISRLPGGLPLLAQWEQEHRAGAGTADHPPSGAAAGQPGDSQTGTRSLPF